MEEFLKDITLFDDCEGAGIGVGGRLGMSPVLPGMSCGLRFRRQDAGMLLFPERVLPFPEEAPG